jgi:cell division protein FtsB
MQFAHLTRKQIAKYAQTFSRLKSQKEAEANRMYGFKRTNEQQSEHIKQLHDREQNLLNQAVSVYTAMAQLSIGILIIVSCLDHESPRVDQQEK